MKRCAQAWITLSPAGLGWDCYRHMEAALAGSVPLVSAPTIHRYRPLLIGEQCLSYHPDEDRIADIVGTALADKERLQAMAHSAREHVRKHLTECAICLDLLARHCGETTGRTQAN
jgi:glycosyltransferase involved in cell wall biosynthesis